jgi:hypothetical protein
MSEVSKTALLFRFPFPGPWGKELTEASHELARDIADEHGLVWKIWLEDRETGHPAASTCSGMRPPLNTIVRSTSADSRPWGLPGSQQMASWSIPNSPF